MTDAREAAQGLIEYAIHRIHKVMVYLNWYLYIL